MCHTYHMNPLTTNEPLIILNTHHLEPLIILNTRFFLNTNNTNNTNNFLHMELLERGRTRISQISRICQCFAWLTDIFFDLSFKPQQVNNHNKSITTTSQ